MQMEVSIQKHLFFTEICPIVINLHV